ALIVSLGLKSVIIPHGMITGGVAGLGILALYYSGYFTPGIWYLILNLPVFFLGWKLISKRFLLYSLYGMLILTLLMDMVSYTAHIQDPWLAALAGGALVGAGSGLIFRSLGSAGGNDIISIILNQKFGIRIGTYNFLFNLLLFAFSFGTMDTDLILYSIANSYIVSQVMEYTMALFNERKMIIIISNHPRKIAEHIMKRLHRGVTFLKGEGGYTGQERNVILTVANPFQLKRIEEIVFQEDPNAFVITGNTFNVLGKGFSQRKLY
ncbi:MAG: YitT family protein, partial [Desulfovibrionales bacterium]|nr:YitT family protein [Desulfovibrionales bacterium]